MEREKRGEERRKVTCAARVAFSHSPPRSLSPSFRNSLVVYLHPLE